MINDVAALFVRDLETLNREVNLYPDDNTPWRSLPGLPNAGGTLVLHVVGNLRYFVGAVLGRSGYVRDRDAEFARRDVPRSELNALVDAARTEVAAALDALDANVLEADFPLTLANRRIPTRLFLLHLSTHLAFHLGQLDYHRRAVTGNVESAGAVPLRDLGVAAG